jgi:hypothetical protein
MNLQAINDFLKTLEYVCVDGTEKLQGDLFNDYEDKNENWETDVSSSSILLLW